MKFTCEKSLLSAAIATVSRAVAPKSAIPALEGILLDATPSGLKLTGYNLETGIQTRVDARVTEPGSVVFPTRLFSDIVRKLPEDVLTVQSGADMMVHIECGVSSFNILAISSEDYPEMPTVEARQGFTVEQNVLAAQIGRTVFAVSTNESKPVHTGALFEAQGDSLTIVAVDGYRLALRREKIHGRSEEPYRFVVPGAALREVERIAGTCEDLMTVDLGARHILFDMNGTILISRLLDGEFLNYKAAIPRSPRYSLILDTKEFTAAVERVSLLISEKLKNPVRCQIEDGIIRLSCVAAVGRAYDECPVEGSADGLEIGFNNRYLLDALKAAEQDRVKMELTTGESPAVIVPEEGDDYLYMVLPVRLRA